MNTQIHAIRLSALAAMLISSAAFARPGLPKQYQAVYVDAETGAQMELKKDKMTFDYKSTSLATDTENTDYKKLLAGEPHFYLQQQRDEDGKKTKLYDVFWITPDATTRREEGGIVFYAADILYTKMDFDVKEKVAAITVVHSADGRVMLDPETKTWQIGWAAQPQELHLVRK